MMMIRVVMTMMAMTMLVKREVIMMKMIKMYDGDVDDDNRVVKIRVLMKVMMNMMMVMMYNDADDG